MINQKHLTQEKLIELLDLVHKDEEKHPKIWYLNNPTPEMLKTLDDLGISYEKVTL